RLMCARNKMHLNLFFALMLRASSNIFLDSIFSDIKHVIVTRVMVTIWIFGIQSTYTWVFIEALFLHNTVIVHTMSDRKISVLAYILLGW
ncbi:hypothetical protein Ciccas_001166, partial [Cichlidogyrus casuarinus]